MHHNHRSLKFRIVTNYFPVPEKDLENPTNNFSLSDPAENDDPYPEDEVKSATNYLSVPGPAQKVIFWKYLPFGLHLALTVIVAAACLFFVDGRVFNTTSRRPEYLEPNGSRHRVQSFALLQSDITTAISLAATVTRVACGWWAGGYLWRSIFMSMERGGISFEGLSRVLSNKPPAPHHFGQKNNMVITFLILFTTYSTDYFSSALNGAITWEPSYSLQPGRVQVAGIGRGVGGENMTNYFLFPESQDTIVEIGSSSANLAWGTIQPNSTNITEPSTTFRRVLNQAQYLPINSTLDNITMPYFVVDAFQWLRYPDLVLKPEQLSLFEGNSTFDPYISGTAMGGLLPDTQWGPPSENVLGGPHIVSETRLLSFRTERRNHSLGPCPANYLIDPGCEINLHQANPGKGTNAYDCHAIANVTYRAGAAVCHDCKIVSPIVVEARGNLTLIDDSFTSMALGLAPYLGTYFIYSGYAVPQNYGTNRSLAIEMISRTYQAAWGTYSGKYSNQWDDTQVKVALPTLRAKVFPMKVFIWVALHMTVLVFGLIFIFIQSRCDHPWAENPTMALFWLDTSGVSGIPLGPNNDCIEVDLWRPGTKFPRDGMLMLEKEC